MWFPKKNGKDIMIVMDRKIFEDCVHSKSSMFIDNGISYWKIINEGNNEFVVYEKDGNLFLSWEKRKPKHTKKLHENIMKEAQDCNISHTNSKNLDNAVDVLSESFAKDLSIHHDPPETNEISAYYPDLSIEIKKSPYSKYIKNINLNTELLFEKYTLSQEFVHVADIKKDFSDNKSVINFYPVIDENEWKNKMEWLYIFTVNNRIVKIGGTRNGLRNRCGSYLCGHYTSERGGKNKCSETNAYIYNTFDFYLSLNFKIQMFGYKIPPLKIPKTIFGKDVIIHAQTYHTYESIALEYYKKENSKFPILSSNADPQYR
jgi:hypothetical protein